MYETRGGLNGKKKKKTKLKVQSGKRMYDLGSVPGRDNNFPFVTTVSLNPNFGTRFRSVVVLT